MRSILRSRGSPTRSLSVTGTFPESVLSACRRGACSLPGGSRERSTNSKKRTLAGVLDVTLYRDDYRNALRQPKVQITDIPFDINGINVVLVDDVLFTGRTVRAALDALVDFGRPKTIQLAVIIDRGNRELPIQPDYAGTVLKTLPNQAVSLKVQEHDGEDSIWLMEHEKGDS